MIDWLMERIVACPSGCWIWAGADSGENGRGSGYAKMWVNGRTVYVHRFIYEKFIGKIPEGYQIDHVCCHWGWNPLSHRRCVNPQHLEAVPHKVNQIRKRKR